MPRPLFDHFSPIASLYDRVSVQDETSKKIAALLNLPAAGWLLDAGGGTGRVSGALTGLVDGIVVVDASPGMLRRAAARPGLRPALGVTEALPFPSGAFARILVADAFHHFHEHRLAAAELWRVLQPGGRLVIIEPDITRWPVKLIALGETALLMRSRFFDAGALAAFFQGLPGTRVTVEADSRAYTLYCAVEKDA